MNDPGDELLQLQFTASTDIAGEIKFYLNLSEGISEENTIAWTMTPTQEPLTYVFPLPDAPITEMRLDPPAGGASLTITEFRLTNRSGMEERRFSAASFEPRNDIEKLERLPDGWRITSAAESIDPFLNVSLAAPIVPPGMNQRNWLRCWLSWGYLSLMLGLVLLVAMFALRLTDRFPGWLARIAYLLFLSLAFSAVGNRGLISQTWRHAQYQMPALGTDRFLEMEITSSSATVTQLFWDLGDGFNEAASHRLSLANGPLLQVLWFPLPDSCLEQLRFDPRDTPGWVSIRSIRIADAGARTLRTIPTTTITAAHQIDRITFTSNGGVRIETTADANDPMTLLSFPSGEPN